MGKQRRRAKRKMPWDLPRYDYYYYRDNEVPKNNFIIEYPFSKTQIDALRADFQSRCPDFDLIIKFRTIWEEGMICTNGVENGEKKNYSGKTS